MSRLQQFHGTPYQIDDTHIRPSSHTGATAASSRGFSSGAGRPAHTDLAFSTHAEHEAWGYAINTGHRYKDHPSNSDPDPKYRSRVYEVAPAADQYQEGGKHGEIQSETGFRVTGERLHRAGETGTFPQVNWNAFKARSTSSPKHVASDQDFNHSYMQEHMAGPEKPAFVPPPFKEAAQEHENRYRAPDARHPDQLNLFTGKTVQEHRVYEATAGVMQHVHPGQFQNVPFHRDPTTSVIRAAKEYHRADSEFGMVHG